jgi:hypothetical protein
MSTRLIWLIASAFALAAVACGPSAPADGDGGGPDVTGGMCAGGATKCQGNTLVECVDGTFQLAEECANVCVDSLGCVLCEPGTGTCNGDMTTMCEDDGQGYIDVYCDPLQGLGCNFELGVCAGDCAPQNIKKGYIGCEYYPTISANAVDQNFTFAVAVSNTSASPANVHIEGGALVAPLQFVAQPGTVEVRELPWVPELKACNNAGGALECGAPTNSSALVADGAYHLRSDRPVTVYQFNPLNYVFGAQNSYSNDASRLLPVNAMTGNYYAASYPAWPGPLGNWPGLITVTGTKDGTQVTIATTANTDAGGGLPAFVAGTAQTITLNAGDVAQLFTTATGGDLTGTVVQATEPVQVIGGHFCTQIPNGVTACDHIEESIFPYEALDSRYIVTAPAIPTLPNGKIRIVRVVATEPNTVLTYDPPQAGAPTTLAAGGAYFDIMNTRESFLITANHKILVNQYMEGSEAENSGIGDPAMALAVPVGQYRTDYQFHAPQNYVTNYVDVVAPMSATVLLDSAPLSGFTPIGNSGYGLLRVQLAFNGTGNYQIGADEPFGIAVYGYGDWTSFWYPGGLDLSPIVIE